MISDEPDEDAASLDDESVFDSRFGSGAAKPDAGERAANGGLSVAPSAQDWPQSRLRDAEFGLDAATLAWFKANHADWRLAIGDVLRGWVASR